MRSPRPPLVLFAVLIVALAALVHIESRAPVITEITPRIGLPGDTLTISGRHFGDQPGEVSVSGIVPTRSRYLEWHDTRIVLSLPEQVGSGLIHVSTDRGRSQGVLFTNRGDIPKIVDGSMGGNEPRIELIEPERATVGTLMTLSGRNFGANRGEGAVLFARDPVEGGAPDSERSQFIAASSLDYDYEFWSDLEIQVRVPEGASTGNIMVVTASGTSNASFFELIEGPGRKTYRNRATYTVISSVEISDITGTDGGEMYLWMPRVQETSAQRSVQILAQEPVAINDNYHGLMLVHLDNLSRNRSYRVSQTFMFDRYAVETRVQADRVQQNYDTSRTLYRVYTAPTSSVPSRDPAIAAAARTAIAREQNPYRRARRLYDFVRQRLSFNPENPMHGAVEGLEDRSGDSFTYASLFTALLRSAGIPARIVAGYLISTDLSTTRHFWAEFYIEDLGWVPVDPALGDQASIRNFESASNPAVYYFGNIDNRRVVFSRGSTPGRRMIHDGRIAANADTHPLQTISEEVSREIESYSIVWNNLQVVGVY